MAVSREGFIYHLPEEGLSWSIASDGHHRGQMQYHVEGNRLDKHTLRTSPQPAIDDRFSTW